MVTYPYAYMTYIVSPLPGLGGAYRGGRPPTACLNSVIFTYICYIFRTAAIQMAHGVNGYMPIWRYADDEPHRRRSSANQIYWRRLVAASLWR